MDRIGITLRDLSYTEMLASARLADRAGLHSAWVPESVGKHDAMTIIAALARETSTCRLATGVLNVYSRHPVQTLMAACTLDEISSGRFMLGVGSGNREQLRKIGAADLDRPIRRVREFVEIVRQGLDQDQSSYQGELFAVSELAQRSKRPDARVPVCIAAHNPQMLRLAGEVGDGVLLNMLSIEELPRARAHIEEGRQKAGRDGDFDLACYVLTCLSDDEDEARRSSKTVIASFCASPIFRRRLENLGSSFAATGARVYDTYRSAGAGAAVALIGDDMVDQFSVAGNTARLTRRLQELRAAGVTLPILSVFPTPLRLKQFFPPLPADGLPQAVAHVIGELAPA